MKRTIISFLVGVIVTGCAMGWVWYQDREQYTRAIPAVKGSIQAVPVVNGTPTGTTNGAVRQQTGAVAAQATQQQVQITQEKAMEIFKTAYPDYRIEKMKFDTDHGRAHYEIEGETLTREIEIKIDAFTGEIFQVKEEH